MNSVGLGRLCSSFAAFVLFNVAGGRTELQHFRYRRAILVREAGPTCSVLDASVLAHASGSLKDLRLIRDGHQIPYAIMVNAAAQVESEQATIANLQEGSNKTEFDLVMPNRTYTQLNLRLEGRDFVAQAALTGSDEPRSVSGASLGTFPVFDLSSRGLSHSSTLSFQESSFRYLHVILHGQGFRVRGVEVPPSREGQTLFTSVAETRTFSQQGSATVASFSVPAHVPVERVVIVLDPGFAGNFSRQVQVTARAMMPGSTAERVAGTILRVHEGAIQMEEQAIPASLGANLQSDADVAVAIENDGKPPLPLASVILAMRMRTICFDADGPLELVYGDEAVEASGSSYQPVGRWNQAMLGPERLNGSFQPQGLPERGIDRHRGLLAAGLAGFALLWGVFGVRSMLYRRRSS